MTNVFLIAELCSNIHPFTKERINEFVDLAALAGADAVKIQLFRADHFPNEERAAKRPLEFPRELFGWFLDRARLYGLQGGASTFDMDAIDLSTRLGADFVKLATREQHNLALRNYANKEFKGTIYRSVDFDELAYHAPRLPREVTLGCVPRYPTNITNKLLNNIEFKLTGGYLPAPFGWSSHSRMFDDVIVAVRAGATVIEKHIRIDDTDPEARWSLDFWELMTLTRLLKGL